MIIPSQADPAIAYPYLRLLLLNTHACCIDEFFRVTIDSTAAAFLGFVDLMPAAFHGGDCRWRQTDFVPGRLVVISQLQFPETDLPELALRMRKQPYAIRG